MQTSAYFRLSQRLQHGISSALRWSSLRPVQELTIDAVAEGKNVVVLAPTAGGKTEAAFFPILDQLHAKPTSGVGCLYISPLRALLNNQEDRLRQLAGLVGLDVFKWHGDVGAGPRSRFLKKPANVLMTTPESLEVMLTSGRDLEHGLFGCLRFVVVDEIHAFAAGDRGAHLVAILERLQTRSVTDLQRVGLSATVGNPDELAGWLQGTSTRPYAIVDPPRKPSPRQLAIRHIEGEIERIAAAAVPLARDRKSIFFTQGRAATELVREAFESSGVSVFVHHSSVARELREEAEEKFTSKEGPATLVSTSTLELGLDVGDLDVILQLDAPSTVSSFLQRLGRSGRRSGTVPHLEFFTGNSDSLLQAVALINLARRGFVEEIRPSAENLPVLVHQILAQILEHSALKREALWRHLQGPYPFSSIGQETFDSLLDHLLQTDILRMLDGLIVFGDEGERRFGRKNFFDLYSVFETPWEVTVKTPEGRVIGRLETDFVRRMEAETFTFLLAGRTWRAVEVDLDRGLVVARPHSGGEAPAWHGAGGSLGPEVTGEMRSILLGEEEFRFVDQAGKAEINRLREERGAILAEALCPITREGDKLCLHTYAGGRVNATIAALLEFRGVARVVSFGDLVIRFGAKPGRPPLTEAALLGELGQLHDFITSLSGSGMSFLVESKSRGRLAKFQPYLPPDQEGAYLAKELFDFEGATELARRLALPAG